MSGRLTTHVLDTAHGRPASGVGVELWRVGAERELVARARTDADGRTERPLAEGEALRSGTYELVFAIGEYFARVGATTGPPPFLGEVPVRIGIADAGARYHVPLLVSPWAYSTYRGS